LNRQIPAVSIIIPMYNAEKYIGECLDSILAQTFQDFEVIVVDDCSTDNSRAVVESYLPKFARGGGEKLSLLRTEKNSGGGGFPRNIGLRLAVGQYVFFVDSDDAITSTALEELYSVAKKFDADVVHCERYYKAEGETVTTNKNFLKISALRDIEFVTKPTLMSNDLVSRIKKFISYEFVWGTYSNFFRRKLIAENNLEFPKCIYGEDLVFAMYALCLAKNIVQVPTVCYVYRARQYSATNQNTITLEYVMNSRVDFIFSAIDILNKFMDKFDFFKQNPNYKYSVFDFLIKEHGDLIRIIYSQIPAPIFDKIIINKFPKITDTPSLTAFLFSRMNIFNVQLNRQGALIQQMNAHIQKQNEVIRQLQAQLKK